MIRKKSTGHRCTGIRQICADAEINSIAPKYAIQVGQALLDVFNDRNKSIEVRRRALEAVSPLTTEQVKTAIKTAYESLDERLKISAVYAMGKTVTTNGCLSC